MEVKLKTDYLDYYDHWFDLKGFEFDRRSLPPAGYSKSEQFNILKQMGYLIPHFGLVEPDSTIDHEYVVIYEDEFLHAGNGKKLITCNEANKHKGLLYSEFIYTTANPLKESRSEKIIWIGDIAFKLKISCHGDWKTNAQGVEKDIEVTDFWFTNNNFAALYAIDFAIEYETNLRYAIDLNMAPGLRGTGIKDFLTGKEVVNLIKDWLSKDQSGKIWS
jgi:hypothetical protein